MVYELTFVLILNELPIQFAVIFDDIKRHKIDYRNNLSGYNLKEYNIVIIKLIKSPYK